MTAKEKDLNPYASPSASDAQGVSGQRPRFRWRVIPTTLLYLYGDCALLGSLVELALLAGLFIYRLLVKHRALRVRDIPLFWFFIDSALGILTGCVLIVAARSCWKGGKTHWWRAGLLALFGFPLLVGLFSLRYHILR